MRTLLLAGLIAALLAVAGTQALAATRSIRVGNNFFVHRGRPATVTIHRGARLTWRFHGSLHNVTVRRGPQHFRSGNRSHGTFSHRFRRRGTYRIVCTIHPGMRMTVKVR